MQVPLCLVAPADSSIWLVGDHEQLGPVVRSSAALKADLHVSMMQRFAQQTADQLVLLLSYRSHPSILGIYNNTVLTVSIYGTILMSELSLIQSALVATDLR